MTLCEDRLNRSLNRRQDFKSSFVEVSSAERRRSYMHLISGNDRCMMLVSNGSQESRHNASIADIGPRSVPSSRTPDRNCHWSSRKGCRRCQCCCWSTDCHSHIHSPHLGLGWLLCCVGWGSFSKSPTEAQCCTENRTPVKSSF